LGKFFSPLFLCLCLFLILNTHVNAFDGISTKSTFLKPGKFDVLFKVTDTTNEYNLLWWSPTFKGGIGMIRFHDIKENLKYIGGFFSPLQSVPHLGELIIGAQYAENNIDSAYEILTEYRFPFGFGIGGGIFEDKRSDTKININFGKISFRNSIKHLQFISTLLLQKQKLNQLQIKDEIPTQKKVNDFSVGGYFAIFNELGMIAAGYDQEQWRMTFGFIAPDKGWVIRPSLDVLMVDNTIGDLDGLKVLLVNFTMKYQGGFLSIPDRLGRGLGPQGLVFENPIGFVFPTWNRLVEVWEIGGLMNARYDEIKFPDGNFTKTYNGILFPFQLDTQSNFADSIFIGGSYTDLPSDHLSSLVGGFFGNFKFLQIGIEINYEIKNNDPGIVIGIIDKF